ncbi:unnamed protein product [Arabis nemorensis]|uniref:Uncharacterized protein n=1 Tax=Arabis nemorensis TaxID=586526 RepID=A0A565AT24_9BRAS|nr:unnamed protein product [Arabis nemorensis]
MMIVFSAYYNVTAAQESSKFTPSRTENPEYISPRDFNSHVPERFLLLNVSYVGLGRCLRIAFYKACWHREGACTGAGVLEATDEAIHDGVDVSSLSLASKVPLYPETDVRVGAFAKGFPVVAAAVTLVLYHL